MIEVDGTNNHQQTTDNKNGDDRTFKKSTKDRNQDQGLEQAYFFGRVPKCFQGSVYVV